MLKADSLPDSDSAVTSEFADDKFGQQMSFTDKRNPYEN